MSHLSAHNFNHDDPLLHNPISAGIEHKFPSRTSEKNNKRSRIESRIALFASIIIAIILAYAWKNWRNVMLPRENDIIYYSGLLGGTLMLIPLLYAARKRFYYLKQVWPMEWWYYFHLFGGIAGPFVIILHTRFSLGSINSAVALFTMLTIVVSGYFGRYIMVRMGYKLQWRFFTLQEKEKIFLDNYDHLDIVVKNSALTNMPQELYSLKKNAIHKLRTFSNRSVVRSSSIGAIFYQIFINRIMAHHLRRTLSKDLESMFHQMRATDCLSKVEQLQLLAQYKCALAKLTQAIIKISHVNIYEQVFMRWRYFHVPLIYIFVLTSVTHILAIHIY